MSEIKDIGLRIKKIDDLLCKHADYNLNKLGITFAQHHALVYLIHQDNHEAPLKQIESHFRVSQATMAGIAKRMEERGLISSYTSEKDKRIKFVKLTNKGEEICKQTKIYMQENEQKMRSLYTEEEMLVLDEFLNRLFNALDTEEIK